MLFLGITILQNYLLLLKWLIIAVSALGGNLELPVFLKKSLRTLTSELAHNHSYRPKQLVSAL